MESPKCPVGGCRFNVDPNTPTYIALCYGCVTLIKIIIIITVNTKKKSIPNYNNRILRLTQFHGRCSLTFQVLE